MTPGRSRRRPVAVVSGAARGIGREVVQRLAADHGFTVLAGVRDVAAARPFEHGAVEPVELDVCDQDAVDRLAALVAERFGGLDVLVNNAGILGPMAVRFEHHGLERARREMEVNAFGAWRLTEALLPSLRAAGAARVINVSSGSGQLAAMEGELAGYRMSKAALNAFTCVLAAEEAEHGISVNSVDPGWVRTEMGGPDARIPVEEGADTILWLATVEPSPTHGFFHQRRPIPW